MRTEFDAPLTRQKYITSQRLYQHGRTPLCTECSLGTGSHSSDCRVRFESTWTRELAEAEGPVLAAAEVANRAVDAVPMDPNVRVSEPMDPAVAASGQPVSMEVNTTKEQTGTKKIAQNSVVEREGGAAPQPELRNVQQKHT